jgi:hypothetical protein
MKVEVTEYQGCFSIDLSAETIAEAAKLTRLGMNSTKELRGLDAYASENGTFTASCVVAKARKATSQIPRLTRH